MEYPRVTIVTPTLNQGKYIRETLESVAAQDYPNLEHIVMDGGSTDGTLDIVRDFQHTGASQELHLFTGPDSGQADAINRGMNISSGLIVSWLNSDDTLLPGAVSEAVETFNRSPVIGVVYGRTMFVDEGGTPLFPSSGTDWYEDLWVKCHNPIPQPSAFIRREAWTPLDTSLNYFFDWDLWLKISTMGCTMVHVPALWSTYRLHPESKTCGTYPVEELARIYSRHGSLFPAVHHRMAEYYSANHQWVHAAISKGKAWISG